MRYYLSGRNTYIGSTPKMSCPGSLSSPAKYDPPPTIPASVVGTVATVENILFCFLVARYSGQVMGSRPEAVEAAGSDERALVVWDDEAVELDACRTAIAPSLGFIAFLIPGDRL